MIFTLDTFRFVKKQNKNVKGLSESARLKRKNRNLVTMKFNMCNWLLELVGTLLIIFLPNSSCFIIYMLLNSCGPPVVYFMGIEENSKTARDIVMGKINFVTKTKSDLGQKVSLI